MWPVASWPEPLGATVVEYSAKWSRKLVMNGTRRGTDTRGLSHERPIATVACS